MNRQLIVANVMWVSGKYIIHSRHATNNEVPLLKPILIKANLYRHQTQGVLVIY